VSGTIIFYSDGLELNIGVDEGQLLKPAVTDIRWDAPSKRSPGARMTVTMLIPEDLCPSKNDISWLMFKSSDPRGRLKAFIGLLLFEPDTLVVDGMEEEVG